MLSWFQALLPKEDDFFRLFNAHAATLTRGADAMRHMLDGGNAVPAWCAKIVEYENEADVIAGEVLTAVRRSFITPFDRSDIRGLTESLDDAIDQMQKTAKSVTLYDLREFSPQMRELGDIAVRCATLTVEAVSLLPTMNKHRERVNSLTEQLSQLENESDILYDQGMKALYEAQKGAASALDFVIGADLYDHLEKVIDRFEDVADRISGILVEHL